MTYAWHDIHETLMQTASTLRFQQGFMAVREAQPPLWQFADPAALLDALHHGTASPAEKNAWLRALVAAAQAEDGDTALTLILLALWPGMDTVRHRLMGRRRISWNEATSSLLARVTEMIRTLDLTKVTWIAETLLRNAERDIGRDHLREANRQARRVPVDPDTLPMQRWCNDPAIPLPLLERDLERVIGRDASLLIRVGLLGFSQAKAGQTLGLSAAGARKRYQRASRRLQETLH